METIKVGMPSSAASAAAFGGAEVPEGMGTQAQAFWQMLDDLAESDPEAYAKFIDEQKEAVDVDRGFVHPDAHVVLKATLGGASGAPLPELPNKPDTSALRAAPRGAKLLVNLCTTGRIMPPTLPDGRPVAPPPGPPRAGAPPTASAAEAAAAELSLTINTAVGDARVCQDKGGRDTYVVDILFHPWVAQHRLASPTFSTALAEFALGTVAEAAAVGVSSPGKYLTAAYRGWAVSQGQMGGGVATWPFFVAGPPEGAPPAPTCVLSKPAPKAPAQGPTALSSSAVVAALGGQEAPVEAPAGVVEAVPLPPRMGGGITVLESTTPTREDVMGWSVVTCSDGALKWVVGPPPDRPITDVLVGGGGSALQLLVDGCPLEFPLVDLAGAGGCEGVTSLAPESLRVKRSKTSGKLTLRMTVQSG